MLYLCLLVLELLYFFIKPYEISIHILQDGGFVLSDHISTSIFYDASLSTATDSKNMHMLNPGGSITTHLLSATSFVNNDGEAVFALATSAGSIILLKLPPFGVTGE